MKYCTQCENQVGEEDQFCGICGHKIDISPIVPAAVPTIILETEKVEQVGEGTIFSKKLLFIAIVLGFLFVAGFVYWGLNKDEEQTVVDDPAIVVYYYGVGCCNVVSDFLEANNIANKVSFEKKEVWDNIANLNEKGRRAKACGIKPEEMGVPAVYGGDGKCYVGEMDVINFFKTKSGMDTETSSLAPTNLESSFTCPENYSTPKQKTDALTKFISDYKKNHPNATVQDLYTSRHTMLVSHFCYETLANLLKAITPDDLKLYFAGKDFGPQNIEFDGDTNIWSSYYTLNGQGLTNPDESIILNFYLQGVLTSQPFTIQSIAQVSANSFSQDSNSTVISKFTAPDNITKKPAYFFTYYKVFPDQNYAYLYSIKLASIKSSVYSVIYSKKFSGDASNLQSDINNWIIQNKGTLIDLSNVGVDVTWLDYFASKQK